MQLKAVGFPEWGQRLLNAIEAGSTGGEIVMALRWHLRGLEKAGADLPRQTRQLIQEIIREINKAGW